MKSKSPYPFWLRWLFISGLHAVAFTTFWINNNWLFAEWYRLPIFHFVSALILVVLQFWAMPAAMRPNARRWFSASILAQALAVILHACVMSQTYPSVYPLELWLSLFLAPALAQSWALSERFKRAWIFGLAYFLPAYLLLAQLPIPALYQNYALFDICVQILRSVLMGASLVFLQQYQSKETSSLSASHERLVLQEESSEATNQEEFTSLSRSNEL